MPEARKPPKGETIEANRPKTQAESWAGEAYKFVWPIKVIPRGKGYSCFR